LGDPYTTLRDILEKEIIEFDTLSIVDIGTGYGHGLEIILNVLDRKIDFSIYCIDSSSDSIEWLRENFKMYRNVYFKKALAEYLPFPDNFFNIAILSLVLHHIRMIERALKEVLRVVKPNGYINIIDWTQRAHIHDPQLLKNSMSRVLNFIKTIKYKSIYREVDDYYYLVIRKSL